MRSKAGRTRKALSKQTHGRAGFTLLEMLIVLFLITLGYTTLYSSGLGESTETNALEQSKVQTFTAIRYARKLALAGGAPIAVRITDERLEVLASDLSTPVQSPITRKSYTVDAPTGYRYKTSDITTVQTGNTLHDAFFFEGQGKLAYAGTQEHQFYPLKNAVQIYFEKKQSTSRDENVPLLDISNVTGELIRH